jgi:hypothetical protein
MLTDVALTQPSNNNLGSLLMRTSYVLLRQPPKGLTVQVLFIRALPSFLYKQGPATDRPIIVRLQCSQVLVVSD